MAYGHLIYLISTGARYPLILTNIAITNGPVDIESLPMNGMAIFQSCVKIYQSVTYQ